MKKQFIILVFGTFILLSGCSNNVEWQIEITKVPFYKENVSAPIELKVMENEKLVSNLEITVVFEMAKMDHGQVEAILTENEDGFYEGTILLPMEGEWEGFLTIKNGNKTVEDVIKFTVSKEVAIAKINGEGVYQADLDFYEFINLLHIEINREADKVKYSGDELDEAINYWNSQVRSIKNKNTLLTQIIRLRSVALLAKEKGYSATEEEVIHEVEKIKEKYRESPIALEMIKQYGEKKFWDKEKSQYKLIVLANKVQQDLIEKVREENPDAGQDELNMLTQRKYEELLVSQVNTLDIEIIN
ncbi:FixH family protein [Chengkuizengella sediminis]|uniref:FixH family protein n=1 Tax=Chengkuizengella sediminis TaxID=1885917 RepID=UPI00138A3A19|nr:FixH family protein [Chengkuizengella sediminis]NDI33899.1 hypothetical protein [Chengkuizengella sediminis]